MKMEYKIKYFLLFLIFTYGVIAMSQSPQENLEKYWNYRNRLKTKFIVSTNQFGVDVHHVLGVNIPAAIRTPVSSIDQEGVDVRPNTMSWGDATCDIGYYLAILASEYKLLNDHGQDIIGTANEIIRSLVTIERLDHVAETHYGASCPFWYSYGGYDIYIYPYDDGCFNGFFVRDDVQEGFTEYWANNGYPEFADVLTTKSDFFHPSGDLRMAEMSQDQVWNLLVGLAMVKHLVDLPNTFYDGDGEMVTLKKWAQKITYRILNYMRGNLEWSVWIPCNVGSGCWPGHYADVSMPAWIIRNPVTGEVVMRGGMNAEVGANAYHFAETGNWITEGIWGNLHYENAWEPIYIFPLPLGLGTTDPKYYVDNSIFSLQTVSGQYAGSSYDELIYWINQCALWYNRNLPDNNNDCKLFAFEHYPLMYLVLHDEDPSHYYFNYYMSFVENVLNLAPMDGPFRFIYDVNNDGLLTGDDYPCREWATVDRLRKPIGVAFDNLEPAGEYAGLSYMLLHNLYWLVYYDKFGANKTVNDNFPFNYVDTDWNYNLMLGSNTNKTNMHINSLNEITANNIIASDGKVTYRAGNKISFTEGFRVEAGASFSAKVDQHKGLIYSKPALKSGTEETMLDNIPNIKNNQIKEITDVNKELDNSEIKIYPNPTNGKLTISGLNDQEIYLIEVHDMMGKVVYSSNVKMSEETVNMSKQPNGIYFVKIISNDQNVTKQLIKD